MVRRQGAEDDPRPPPDPLRLQARGPSLPSLLHVDDGTGASVRYETVGS